ncbi:MAG: D-glycero-beta-D-manno-heptose 1-phosphate adenylyltransferase [Oceanicaulis sp.]|jgi:D-beta-D-heptose 7-phosphate kinase/D-beta-D-heptose 1-phosphate adenosyltransferase|nr:D-glycero-beta-D-manno-heptose 1-phosphate adenylyltransferase [Oceanicaulis sp.]
MLRERAAHLLAAIQNRRAMVLGDLLYDSFVYGDTHRISREAPVPILSEKRRTAMLGGAGNLARNLSSLGAEVRLISVAGTDADGDAAIDLVKAACGDAEGVVRTPERPTPSKIRYVSNNQQMFCVDRDPTETIRSDTVSKLLNHIKYAIEESDILIVSDYGRGVVTRELVQAAIALAREAGKPVSVDPRGHDYSRYDGASIIKPNAGELEAETGLTVSSDDDAATALIALKAQLSRTEAVMVTRGGAGMTLLDETGSIHHHRSRPREVYDVSGAGDTALAGLSLAMAAGASLKDAMEFADLAAGVAVGKPGTATVSPEEVLDAAQAGEEAPDWRIMSRPAMAALSADWRASGLKVGFTNGCFDLLHPGHLSVLRHAASVCDRLIVGLNADASVKRLKGENRPINDQVTRATMLASLEMVDRVVIFDEDTPAELISEIRPHVMVKGADYVADELPGADFIRQSGGEIVLAPLMDGLSTTNIVNRLRQDDP